ncbi:MAG: non-contractile tail sheath protein, partial [Bryobacteraceae bacterium]
SALAGGSDGNQSANGTNWFTDLSVTPRINRAARDWHSSFFKALKGYGIDVTASFSMELGNGDPSVTAGVAQRHSTGEPVVLNTPSLQTNFSPTSIAFWQQVYADMAAIQNGAGVVPYLQFGEVQWWYFPYNIVGQQSLGMPFYDAYTTSAFQAKYGYPLPVIATNDVIPSTVPDAAAFLPGLIGAFTQAVMGYVLASYPNCRFEVLYPTDVNNTSLNQVINYPTAVWTPQKLTCLKTESFSYTFERNLDMAAQTIATGEALGFLPSQRSHLVGLEMASTAWLKEARLAEANALDSVVLFALDQFCLIGYAIPLGHGMRRSSQFGQ